MDQPPAEREPPNIELAGPSSENAAPPVGTMARPARRGTMILGIAASLVALAALGIAAWTYAEARRDMLRLSTDIAQLRLSLDLYAQRSGNAAGTAGSDQLSDLANRLALLEQAWRDGAATPAANNTASASTPAGATPGAECLPPGMRILVAAGDRYPICDNSASIAVGGVDNGYVTLADGTTIPSGGTMPLGTTGCMVAVTSGGDEGLTGYAEIRVSC